MINVLMIEDDSEFAQLLTEYLAKFNIQVTNFEDPYLGISAGIKNYDLLILDLTLPGMKSAKRFARNTTFRSSSARLEAT